MKSKSHPKLREDEALRDRQRLENLLHRLEQHTRSRQASALTRLGTCRNELRSLLPLLVSHVQEEEVALTRPLGLRKHAEPVEALLAENIARLRELRALLESTESCLADDESGGEAVAEALLAYLSAWAGDWIEHEEERCPLRQPEVIAPAGV